MGFRIKKSKRSSAKTPEALFQDLRSREVEGLLSQQADMLRRYMDEVDRPDVAMQLPTGSGKTLVGLLIAEWRRTTKNERAVYLCPTKQLVNQVVEQSVEKYGIHVLPFTGSKHEYSGSAKTKYNSGEAVAVTTYSSLFNTNPYFDKAQFIILDDAHAAENYLGDFWSLRIGRRENKTLYEAVLSLFKSDMHYADYTAMAAQAGDSDGILVNKLPTPLFHGKHAPFSDVLDAHSESGDISYKWSVLRGHLSACHLYYASGRFMLRPLLPPAETHAPFANANQRVYMSATLGEGGELERLVGKRELTRIKAPEEWSTHGIGRRLFFFPSSSLDEEASNDLVIDMIDRTGRGLVLTPSHRDVEIFRAQVSEKLPNHEIFSAGDIEESKRTFVDAPEAVALVANRYDGIDLIGDECRLLVASGLPRATNLQEQFLMDRLAAQILYQDRIRTRIVQATGRCTRSATDYAAVVILGDQLTKFLLESDTRQYFHPELQAEIQFGIDESSERTPDEFMGNLELFLEQGKDWRPADALILELRDSLAQEPLPNLDNFVNAVEHEVGYQYALWNEDFDGALEAAKQVLTCLDGPGNLRGYRAFWRYLAGNAAWLSNMAGRSGMDAIARDYYGRAARASQGLIWLRELSHYGLVDGEPEDFGDFANNAVIERLELSIESLGYASDYKFEAHVKSILDGLSEGSAAAFEQAQVSLGQLLGYRADNTDATGGPDPWWIVTDSDGIVFEDFTDCTDDAKISVSKVRQAAGHQKWLKKHEGLGEMSFVVVLVTPSGRLDQGANRQAGGIFHWAKQDFVNWARGAIEVVRVLRRTYPGQGDLAWRAHAAEMYVKNGLHPDGILSIARSSLLENLPEGDMTEHE